MTIPPASRRPAGPPPAVEPDEPRGAPPAPAEVTEGTTAERGSLAPPLRGTSTDGRPIALARMRGKPVVVAFCAPFAAPCVRVWRPAVAEAERAGKASSLHVVTVWAAEDAQDVARVVGRTGERAFLDMHLGLAEGEGTLEQWKVKTMPTFYVLDGAGIVRFAHAGIHDGEAAEILGEAATLGSGH